jgi:hypothetical protein
VRFPFFGSFIRIKGRKTKVVGVIGVLYYIGSSTKLLSGIFLLELRSSKLSRG